MKFRRERDIDKTKDMSDTIPRMNIKTFKSIDKTKICASRKREKKKESAQAQRIVNVAKEIEYEMKEVLKYDFLPSLSYLFYDTLSLYVAHY